LALKVGAQGCGQPRDLGSSRVDSGGCTAGRLDDLWYFYILGIMNEKTAVTALAALAHEARLRVPRALVGAAPPC
jgi:hypothetical protein